jgi:hypothetical protein
VPFARSSPFLYDIYCIVPLHDHPRCSVSCSSGMHLSFFVIYSLLYALSYFTLIRVRCTLWPPCLLIRVRSTLMEVMDCDMLLDWEEVLMVVRVRFRCVVGFSIFIGFCLIPPLKRHLSDRCLYLLHSPWFPSIPISIPMFFVKSLASNLRCPFGSSPCNFILRHI